MDILFVREYKKLLGLVDMNNNELFLRLIGSSSGFKHSWFGTQNQESCFIQGRDANPELLLLTFVTFTSLGNG